MKCTICGSDHVSRSHRRGMEKIFRYFFPATPYRCKECWSRFWVFENPFSNTGAKIAGVCMVCLLIAGLAWYLWPRKEETSWQAVQRNVGAVPESVPHEPVTEKSPSDAENRTDQEKTGDREQKEAEVPAEPEKEIPGPENGISEKPGASDSSGTSAHTPEIMPVPPIQPDISGPVSESGDKQDESPDLPGESAGEKTLPETTTAGSETGDAPDKKTEQDKDSVPVLPETAETVPAASDTGTSAAAGSEAPENLTAEAVQKIGDEHTEKSDSSDAGFPQTGKKETDQTAAETVPSVPETATAVTVAPAKLISESVFFRELKTVKTQSGKENFEVYLVTHGPVPQYNSFSLLSESPPKLVVDLPGKWKYSGPLSFRVKDDMVLQVRLGKHKDFLRVVLDLKIRGPVHPVFSETDEGLSVILKRRAE